MPGTADRNASLVVTASATARLNFTSQSFTNQNYRGIRLYVDVTGKSSAGFKPTFKLRSPIVGTTKFLNLWVSSASTTANTMKVLLYPGVKTASTGGALSTAASYTKVISDILPPVWQIISTHAGSSGSSKNGNRATFGIYADLLQ